MEIVAPRGPRVFRVELGWRRFALAVVFLVALCGAAACGVAALRDAQARAGESLRVAGDERLELQKISAQAASLESELRALKSQNDQIRKLIGDGRGAPRSRRSMTGSPISAAPTSPSAASGSRGAAGLSQSRVVVRAMRPDENSFAQVDARIQRLRSESAIARSDGRRLERIALRVLNMRRLEKMARARVLAAIPSINPAGTAGIASAFGWRVDPWPEFHAGVDLDANYAEDVRSGAAGTVVAAGFDGGYGIKVDIDHGNGYHTWYCHLSRADVRPGQYVNKAEHIALVGSTGASTGPHLHYQIMLDGHAVDPVPYLNGVPKRVLASLK